MISDILQKIAEAIRTNKAIDDFCDNEYNRAINILIGQNIEKVLVVDLLPAVVIAGVESIEANSNDRTWTITIGVAVGDEGETIDEEKPNVKIYDGFINCETLSELVINVLLDLPHKSSIRYIGIQSEVWPIFLAQINFVINKIWPVRGLVGKD